MKDRAGLEYDELLAIQTDHLAQWKRVILPALFAEVKRYILAQNRAAGSEGRHQVFRGADIGRIILTWDNLGPEYPAKDYSGI
jgi:hypothetical protein